MSKIIKVAIVDDSLIQLELLKRRLADYSKDKDVEFEVASFSDGNQFIDKIKSGKDYDIYILDVILGATKGTDIASELRNNGKTGYVLFYTATTVFEKAVDDLKPCGYFIKTAPVEGFYELLDEAIK